MTRTTAILAISLLVALVVPLAWGVAEWWRSRASRTSPIASPWSWRTVLGSMLLCVLAFNLTFFVQELFLVLPKAFTPGLQPTLYHNNHGWAGEHPLAALFQGTGALATAVMGLACLRAVRRGAGRTPVRRMLLVWFAFCGLLMALPQVVIGAISDGSDVGMAMGYLRLPPSVKIVLAGLALAAMPCVALALRRPVLALAGEGEAATARGRAWHMWKLVTLPALLATVVVLPYRVPREWLEVVLLPVLVLVPGVAWMQASAWRASTTGVRLAGTWPLGALLIAAVAVWAFFQGVLRLGVPFY